MNHALELPELGRAPRGYTVYHASTVSAKVALALLDGPYGRHAGTATIAAEVIYRVLNGWLQEIHERPGDPKGKTIGARLTGGRIVYRLKAEYGEFEDGSFRIDLNADAGAPTQCAVGKRLREAEKLRGLGQSALSALAHAADASVPILLPETMMAMAGPTKFMRDYLGKYPAWAINPTMLPRETLQYLANPKRTLFTGKLARAILAVEDAVAKVRGLKLPKTWDYITAFPLIVHCERSYHWESGHNQLLDAYRNRQGGEQRSLFHMVNAARDIASIVPVIEHFLTSIAQVKPVLLAVDTLIRILEGDKRDDE